MHRQLRPLSKARAEEKSSQLSAAELRVLLAQAEARERNEIEELRAEIERLRKERAPAAVVSDPAFDQPDGLHSTARALPPVLNVDEAADVLRVSVSTVRNWIRSGRLAAGQTAKGSRIMIPRDAVLCLLGERRQ